MKKYLLPITLGFAGMLVAHVIILLGFGLGIQIPLYFLAYPVVYAALAFLLTKSNPAWWLSNVICILVIPFLYWYWLLWDIDKFGVKEAVSFQDAGGMLVILPVTFVIALMISRAVGRTKPPKNFHYDTKVQFQDKVQP